MIQSQLNWLTNFIRNIADDVLRDVFLATVHWVAAKENIRSSEDLVGKVYAWSPGKREFTPRQIRVAVERLVREDWIPPIGSAV